MKSLREPEQFPSTQEIFTDVFLPNSLSRCVLRMKCPIRGLGTVVVVVAGADVVVVVGVAVVTTKLEAAVVTRGAEVVVGATVVVVGATVIAVGASVVVVGAAVVVVGAAVVVVVPELLGADSDTSTFCTGALTSAEEEKLDVSPLLA